MEIDPRYLRYLQALHLHGTFIRAAEAEGISQPALTNKIHALERQLGTALVDRGRFGARVNDRGKLLLRHARAIDAIVDRASEEIALSLSGAEGPLVIGATPISMIDLVPRALGQIAHTMSRVRLSIIEAYDDILLDRLRAGEIEVMIGGLLVGQCTPDIIAEPLVSLPLQAVVGRANWLWHRDKVALSELLDNEWALPASGSVIRSYVDAIFVASGEAMPSNFWTCDSLHGLKSIIRNSGRVSLMPAHAFAQELKTGTLKGLVLDGPTSSRKLDILRLKQIPLSPAGAHFVDCLRTAASDVKGSGSARRT
jgi:DNA-binding transcriptional LysR family regulator